VGLVAVVVLVAALGIAQAWHPRGGAMLAYATPLLGSPVVAFGMSQSTPEYAIFGLVYLTVLVALGAFFQGRIAALLSTAWTIACFLGWSATVEERSLLSDAVMALPALGGAGTVAGYLAYALRRSHGDLDAARRDAEALSLRDPLTGLANRRALDVEVRRRATERRLGGILIVDIDHFKTANDQFGHIAGDEVLVDLAQRLTAAVRAADLVARLGGDEFAILLEGPLSADGLRRVAGNVHRAVSNIIVETSNGSVHVTISIGGALTLERPQLDNVIGGTRAHADNALYEAKQNGRNRVVLDTVTAAPVTEHHHPREPSEAA
jgi:diguanylate cyclase (GGDEF)-like protein